MFLFELFVYVDVYVVATVILTLTLSSKVGSVVTVINIFISKKKSFLAATFSFDDKRR